MTKASITGHVALVAVTWVGVSMCMADAHPGRSYTSGGPTFAARRHATRRPASPPPPPSTAESTVVSAPTPTE